ncbi:MAG: hypothetical protein N2C14_00755 [Planctomycetales bacterium]
MPTARERVTHSIIAEAIQAVGLWLACLAPLGLAGYLFFTVHRATADEGAINEILVLDLASDHLRLLSPQLALAQLESREPPRALPAPDPADGREPDASIEP